jgi:hypothetical protein
MGDCPVRKGYPMATVDSLGHVYLVEPNLL